MSEQRIPLGADPVSDGHYHDQEPRAYNPAEMDGLEVDQRHSQLPENGLHTHPVYGHEGLELDHRNRDVRDGLYVDDPGKHQPVVKQETYGQHAPGVLPAAYSAGAFPAEDHPPKKTLSRNTKILIGVIAAVVILGVVLGATLGVILPKRSSSSVVLENEAPPSPTPTPAPTNSSGTVSSAVLDNSNIASFSTIDDFKNTLNGVLFQDPSGALMLSMWNSSTNAWNVTNVSAELNAQGEPINLKKGSPISVDYPDDPLPGLWGTFMNVRYVNAANNLQYAHQWWIKERGWVPWSVRTTVFYGDNIPSIMEGSQLSAVFTGCSVTCRKGSLLMYQDQSQSLVALYDTYGDPKWKKGNFGNWVDSPRLVPNRPGSLTVFKYTPSGSNATGPAGLRAYVDVSGRLQEYYSTGTTAMDRMSSWSLGTANWPLSDEGPGSATYLPPKISGTSWGDEINSSGVRLRENLLVTMLHSNGTVVVRWRKDTSSVWGVGFPSVTNISALTVTSAMKAYCIRNGKVEEYSINKNSPDKWDLVGEVPLTV